MRFRAKIISPHLGDTVLIESEVDAASESEARDEIKAAALFVCNYVVMPDDRVIITAV